MEFLKITEILLRRKRIVLIVFSLFFFIFVALASLLPATYKASAKLFVQSSSALSSLMAELDMPQNDTSSNTDENIFETKTELAKIRPLLTDLISDLQLKDRDNETMEPDDLVKSGLISKFFPQPSVKIEQNEDAAILKITSTSSSPEEAAAISNTLAKLYVDYNVERAREGFVAVKEYLHNKLAVLQQQYNASFAALTTFKVREHAEALETEQENIISRLYDLSVGYEESLQSLALKDKEIQQAEQELQKVSKYRKETKGFSKDDERSNLENQLDTLLVQLAAKSAVYQKEHPEYRQLEKELAAVQKLIKERATIVLNKETVAVTPLYDSLTSQLAGLYIDREVERKKSVLLQDNIAEYERKLKAFPEKLATLTKLELTLSSDQEIYESFLKYMNKVQLAEAVVLTDTRIVESAKIPEKQNFPKKKVMYLIGFFLGAFWGPLTAFFFEYIDTTIHSPEDIRHLDQLTVLGTLPNTRRLKGERLLTCHQRNAGSAGDALCENYRTIRHNLRFSSAPEEIKTLLVTSSGNSEGKSSFAVNFALSCVKVHGKVLLADLNLRQPALHRYLSLTNEHGIVDLVKDEMKLQDAVQATAVSGLDFLAAGNIQDNFEEVVESENLWQRVRDLSDHYDIILLDTPSLGLTSDALILGSMVDYLVYIAAYNRTELTAVEEAAGRFQQAGIQRVGCVVNKYQDNRLPALPVRFHLKG